MKEIFLLLIWLVISFTPILILFMGLGSLQDIGYRYAANKYIRKKKLGRILANNTKVFGSTKYES